MVPLKVDAVPDFSCVVLGIEFKSLCLCDKYFIDFLIPESPWNSVFFLINFFLLHLLIYLDVRRVEAVWVPCVWRSEDSLQELVHSFHGVVSGVPIWVLRYDDKQPYRAGIKGKCYHA